AAAAGTTGTLRHDHMAMLPFCGYNMGDYFAHWLRIGGATSPEKLPRIYYVNWFRKDGQGQFLWPGYGENIRVLKWIVERLEGKADASPTPIGNVPAVGSLDVAGLDFTAADLCELLSINHKEWLEEMEEIRIYYSTFG